MKKQTRKMSFAPDPIHLEAQKFCFRNDIRIYIVNVKKGFKVEIEENGKFRESKKIYKDENEASEVIWRLYLYIWEKYKSKK